MSELAFSPEMSRRFKETVAKYERPRSALLPVLYLAQEQFGFLSKEAMQYVAKQLELPEAYVYEVVSFYTMFKKKDMGRYCLQVCNNITCCMVGSEEILQTAQSELGIKPGEVTADGMFSLVPVQCLGSCDTGPVVQINDDYFENMTPEKMKETVRKLRAGERVSSSHAEVSL